MLSVAHLKRRWIGLISKVFIILINHLLSQESWARICLINYSGKAARIEIFPFISINFIIQRDGYLNPLNEGNTCKIDTSIILSSNAITSFINGGWPLLIKQVKIDGDMEFATKIAKLCRYLRWDPEEDLSKIFGDECGHRIIMLVRYISRHVSRINRNTIDSITEYWLDENPLLVRRMLHKDFISELFEICDNLDRAWRQIEKFEENWCSLGDAHSRH